MLIASSNTNKISEISRITGLSLEPVSLDLPEVQSLSVEEVARAKAQAAFEIVRQDVLVDDTGLSVDALSGFPGALVSFALKTIGLAGLLRLLDGEEQRGATVSTCLGVGTASGPITFLGEVRGRVSREERGSNGFGYDPIFIPDGSDLTFAEMSNVEKDQHSMRARALGKLKRHLESS